MFSQTGKHVRVLAVGNSFSNDATTYFPQIVKGSPVPCTLTLGKASIGGCDFARHLRHATLHEADPTDPEGKPYSNKTKSLKEMLLAEPWDFVTMQQVSTKSFRPETFRPEAKQLYDYIKRYAPQSEVVIHQTWAYRADEPRFGTAFCGSQQAMYEGLCKAYAEIAGELGCRLIQSGDAMELARRDAQWGGVFPDVNFDTKTATYPNLPDQRYSLHVGYSWRKEKDQWKLMYDGIHANIAGDYLTGCVWFEFFFETTVVGNTFVPDKMDTKDASILQRIAHEIREYNIGLVKKP
ncbi:MAG: DUF4886 domain-containing protein [Planctomycetaceae bacterium]|nr:DUF4886 domain-containing protein [Planctomycetaceae bacterium]